MIKNAESMKEQDRIKRVTNFIKELVDLKNEADTAIHTTEKSLSEYKDKLPQADVDEIQAEITKLKEMIADPNLQGAALKDQIEKVKNATMKIGKAMYGQAGAQQEQS
jgi:molecular chaperone DnaK